MLPPIGSPCAACKLQRRKCTRDCVYAPYFPPDQPEKFLNVHKVYGASNVAKLLNEVNPSQREDVANSLVYDARMRLNDPINGSIAVVLGLHQQLQSVQSEVALARKELNFWNQYSQQINMDLGQRQCPSLGPMMGSHCGAVASPGAASSHVGIGQLAAIAAKQQSIEAHQLAAIAAKQEQDVMMRNRERQPVIRLSGGSGSGSVCGGFDGRMIVDSSSGSGEGGEYSQAGPTLYNAQPSLAVGASAFDPMAYNNQIQQHEIHEQQLVEESAKQTATTLPHQGHVDQLGQRNRMRGDIHNTNY